MVVKVNSDGTFLINSYNESKGDGIVVALKSDHYWGIKAITKTEDHNRERSENLLLFCLFAMGN